MKIVIKDADELRGDDISVDTDDEDISIWQGDDLIMMFDAQMARKVIKAIKKGAKHLGWDLS